MWGAYRRSVYRSLDALLPPDCRLYWPEAGDTLWPYDGDEFTPPWSGPEEFRKPRYNHEYPSTPFPAYVEGRLRTKAAMHRYLCNRGNTYEAREACRQVLAFAWRQEQTWLSSRPEDRHKIRSETWWTLMLTRPETLRITPPSSRR